MKKILFILDITIAKKSRTQIRPFVKAPLLINGLVATNTVTANITNAKNRYAPSSVKNSFIQYSPNYNYYNSNQQTELLY